jgi:regulator of cell morphogenesis and NO signaling
MHLRHRMRDQSDRERNIRSEFTRDHCRLDVLFEDARRLATADNFGGAAAAFRRFAYELGRHIAAEEKHLFPVFDARARMPGPTTMMRHEHRELERLMALAAASLEREDAATFATEAAALAALLDAHNLKEERVLYPRTDAVVDEGERADVLAALQRA